SGGPVIPSAQPTKSGRHSTPRPRTSDHPVTIGRRATDSFIFQNWSKANHLRVHFLPEDPRALARRKRDETGKPLRESRRSGKVGRVARAGSGGSPLSLTIGQIAMSSELK